MDATLRISFHGTAPSVALEQRIRRKVAKLAALGARVSECHVTLGGRPGLARAGSAWSARVELTLPEGQICVSREVGRDHSHENIHVAVGEAFDAVLRRLADRLGDSRERRTRSPAVARRAV